MAEFAFPMMCVHQKGKEMIESGSIVLLGSFNPAIFHPSWFERYKILPMQETQWALGEAAPIKEVDLGNIKLELTDKPPIVVEATKADITFKSLKLTVNQGRFDCIARDIQDFAMISEAVCKIVSILEHTPISSVGFNFISKKHNSKCAKILNNLFCGDVELFNKMFGSDFKVGGKVVFESDGARISIKAQELLSEEGCLYLDANVHRDIVTNQASDARDVVVKHFSNDCKYIDSIFETLVGRC